MRLFPIDDFIFAYDWNVLIGIELNFKIVSRFFRGDAGRHLGWHTRCELAVHTGRRNADALLVVAPVSWTVSAIP